MGGPTGSRDGRMGAVIHTKPTDLDGEDWSWLVGAKVVAIDFAEPASWWFQLSNGGCCSVHDGTGTLNGPTGVIASSDDHGHQFGLPAPVDSVARATQSLDG